VFLRMLLRFLTVSYEGAVVLLMTGRIEAERLIWGGVVSSV